uniref:Transposase of ISCARN101, IS3 family IS3 group,ORFA n=1 Tax=mine drainage metagenome TaxID=410659 RepID=E6QT45_9ZZZZ
MSRIPQARKAAILAKMLLPQPLSIRELSQKEGISEATLYHWRSQLRREGRPVPEHDKSSNNWSSQTKFAVVVETSAMSEVDLNEYCRAKGLYPEQVKQWREISLQAHDNAGVTNADSNRQNTVLRKQNKQLEREILRKDKALAEAAALLMLQKKLRALWGETEAD